MNIELNVDGHYFYAEILDKWIASSGELVFYRSNHKEYDEHYFVFEREIISGKWAGSDENNATKFFVENELKLYLPLYRKALEHYKKLIILL